MGKSDIKKVLMNYVPQCFSKEGQEDLRVVAVLNDSCIGISSSQFLRSAERGNPHATVTLDQAVHNLFVGAVHALQEPDCKLFCHVFDKSQFVTQAKAPTQLMRDNGKSGNNALDCATNRALFAKFEQDNKRVDFDKGKWSNSVKVWKGMVDDRVCKRRLIKELCNRAVELIPKWLQLANVPEDRHVVIDYDRGAVVGDMTDVNVAVLSSAGVDQDLDLVREFNNMVGEFDVSHVHYLVSPRVRHLNTQQHPDEASAVTLVNSIDSDIFMIDMLNADKAGMPTELRVVSSIPASMSGDGEKCKILINPYEIAKWIKEALSPHVQDPCGDFCKVFALSGCDFVQSIPGVGTEAVVTRYLSWVMENQPDPKPIRFLESIVSNNIHKGVKNASVSKRARLCMEVDCTQRALRADFVYEYWKNAATPELVPSHLGMGYALNNGTHVFAEDLTKKTTPWGKQQKIKRF